MSAPPNSPGTPIEDKRQLIAYHEAGSKPPAQWRVGTEHEKFVFRRADLRRVPYDGPDGIAALLHGMTRFGWRPVLEHGNVIALTNDSQCSITLEPGGQFELSGAPLETVHQTCGEVHEHLRQVREVCDELGLGMLGLGFDPKSRREQVPWMPKARYRIMGNYMPKKGRLGLDMMLRTCTVQANLDYESEQDMVRKFRVALALQPVAVALFANSPFVEGKPSGFQSYRSWVWTDTDPDRCGTLPFVFDDGFGFERYVDYMLDVPMYFVYRDDTYIDASGQSFRDFMAGRLPALPGERPGIGDWTDHLTTAFPEVRLKTFLEMRGADGGPWGRLCALPALWVGLLYDRAALDSAYQLIADWTAEEREAMRRDVPRRGLDTPLRSRTLREVALEMLDMARDGLHRRARRDQAGEDETHFLDPLFAIAASGRTPAAELVEDYRGRWAGDIAGVFTDCAY
ncbi:MAG: glutamate--cysteine ligase [Alphaproteobacteria bacterium]|nr:glutamate--cysteine ligase [Alphaproteobacteria bacterium]MBV9862770.1 glutamate--cysteine ligase [Alphaproteobacteria bacterium]